MSDDQFREPSMSSQPRFITAALVIAVVGNFAASISSAAIEPRQIEGRWKATPRELVIDITACGDRFCGRLVTSGSDCGPIVLSVANEPDTKGFSPLLMRGTLDIPGEPSYKIGVSVSDNLKMRIFGDMSPPLLFQRTYPFIAHLARIGDATCRAGATS